jgi:Raf kinase inhibitor-like YbhB/YbcL family protein
MQKSWCLVAGYLVSIAVFTIFQTEAADMSTLKLSSQAFSHSGYIPAKYTCDGPDVNPPLTIENTPPETKSLALIVEDPDAPAGTWVHWVVWNISADTRVIKEHSLPSGAQEGMNDFRKRGYGGPCPPSGTHRYFFKLYALNTTLSLSVNATKTALESALQGRVLSKTELMGLYKRN